MKIFKRLRGFFQRRIPLLLRKKKDKSTKISEGCEEISNQVGKFAQEVAVEMNGSLEQLNEKYDEGQTPIRNDFRETSNEILNGGVQFHPQKTTIFEGPLLEESLINEKRMIPKIDEYKEEKKEISNEDAQFPSNNIEILDGPSSPARLKSDCQNDKRMTPDKDAFIEVKKEMSRKGAPCPLEKYMLWDGPLVQVLDETLPEDKWKIVESLASCDGENEETIEYCPLLAESSEVLECSWDPEKSSKFEVDFESAFGGNFKESNARDPWYCVASTKLENLGHRSKETDYYQLHFENEDQIDEQFEAVFGFNAESYRKDYDAAFDICPENMHRKGYCKEQKSFDDHYDFYDDYDEFSDEETSVQKKKFMVVIRDRPAKNLTFQKLFPYSYVNNTMHHREIKDPLKRKRVHSDLTGFKHVPVWDSSHMKKYYSDGDLSRTPPNSSMAFTKRKK